MIYRATQIVYDALIEDNFKCSIREGENSSTVVAGVNGDNCTFDVLFISQDNENDVSVRIYDLCRFKDVKRDAVLAACNKCNCAYRFVRFTADEDNTVTVSADVPVETANPGKVCVELFIRCMRIVDECYPEIMRAIVS